MAHNHDLTFFPDYLVCTDNLYDYVVFLDLGNRLETFEKDAEILEREYKVVISRIHPRDCLEATVSACRIPIKEGLELIHRLIADGHKVAVWSRRLTKRAADGALWCCGNCKKDNYMQLQNCVYCGSPRR